MDVTLRINGVDYSKKLSSFSVQPEITYRKVVKTLDETEHFTKGHIRNVLNFSFWPLTDDEATELFSDLASLNVTATYTDPNSGGDVTHSMRVIRGFEYAFGMRSVTGNRYYKGGSFRLRQV